MHSACIRYLQISFVALRASEQVSADDQQVPRAQKSPRETKPLLSQQSVQLG